MKILITDLAQPDVELERSLLAAAGMEMLIAESPTPEGLIAAGQQAVGFILQTAPIPRQVFEALPNLRILSCPGVGVDMVDLDAAKEHGVWVANAPTANTSEVAAHALGMALSLVRHLPFYDRSVRAGRWHFEDTGVLRRPSTLTFGLLGLGNIGSLLSKYAAPLFGRIVAFDQYLSSVDWPSTVERIDNLPNLFQQSDIVSLHIPLTEQTHNLVNKELLSQMKPGSYLVNAARGGLLDINALLEALDDALLAGAALDVLPVEPPPANHPILQHPRVLLSPHAGFYSQESDEELRRTSIENIIAWAEHGRPLHVVVEGK